MTRSMSSSSVSLGVLVGARLREAVSNVRLITRRRFGAPGTETVTRAQCDMSVHYCPAGKME